LENLTPINDVTPESTLREQNAPGEARVPRNQPHLFIVLEAERPAAGGARYALDNVEEAVVRRGSVRMAVREQAADRRRLILSIPDRWMSAEHLRFVRDGASWVVEDAGSTNGTLLNGCPVGHARLDDTSLVEAGRTLIALRAAVPTPEGCGEDVDSASMSALPPWQRGLSPALAARLGTLARVARSTVPVILFGETGVGKEVLARALHDWSKRTGPFVAVNCGALPGALVEALLFGHVRGAFSSAIRDELGLVRSAHGGTLFLDEIGDLAAPAQASLLRVLQEREVLPVGATRPVGVDLRVVCATHRNLDELAAQGNFRADLLTRLDGFRHVIPPLRERREELGLLVAALLTKLAAGREESVSFSPPAARLLATYRWPGNVRELEQVLARALAISLDGCIDSHALALSAPPPASPRAPKRPISDADARLRSVLIAALSQHEGNVSAVARVMGKGRTQIQRWMRRFGLESHSYRRRP
jgi:DNA-binding NtrC family response regulator